MRTSSKTVPSTPPTPTTQTATARAKTVDGATHYATFDSRDRMRHPRRPRPDLQRQRRAHRKARPRNRRDPLPRTTRPSATSPQPRPLPATRSTTCSTARAGAWARRSTRNLTQGLLYSPEAYGPVAELDENNDLIARFIYADAHVPAYMVKNGTTYRLMTDQLGSVVMVVDARAGRWRRSSATDRLARCLTDSNPGFQPFGFAGGIYDTDTGLTHFGAREYDAGLGRWTATDPIGLTAATRTYMDT